MLIEENRLANAPNVIAWSPIYADSRQKFTESGVEFAQVCEQLQQNFGFCQPQSGVWKKRQNFQNWMQSEDFEDWLKNEEYL